MSNSVLRDKTKKFAKKIILLCRALKEKRVESAILGQLLRCGTSIGANVHEAQYAQGTKDFISKFEIALKECNQCEYWLVLLLEIGDLDEEEYTTLKNDCIGIRRMIVSSVTTLKNKD